MLLTPFEALQGFLGLTQEDQEKTKDYILENLTHLEGADILGVWRPYGGKLTLIVEDFDIRHEVIDED